jgi:hypothetical protein
VCQFLCQLALLVSVISFVSQTSEGATPTPKTRGTKYGRVVFGGYDTARMSDACLVFEGSMTSSDFFDGLEKIENSESQTLFRKKSRSIDRYPDELTVDLKVTIASCGKEAQPVHFTNSLSLKPEWKAGMQFTPAELLSHTVTEERRLTPTRSVKHYVIQVKCQNIPITSHIVVTILDELGERIGRVSVGL